MADNYLKKYFVFVPTFCLMILLIFQQERSFIVSWGKIVYQSSDSINTLTSIFAGIYFSLYTLLLAIPSFSVIKKLNRKNYKCLLITISVGLLTSLIYSLFQVLIAFLKADSLIYGFNFIVVIAFVLSVIQNIIFFGIILGKDLGNSYSQSNSDQLKEDIKYIKEWVHQQTEYQSK
ncbi:hypothetical protein FC19_GL001451 [Liquorilactobacillus aquaticus DSM 21051]|uniref:Uncharacterized protein n=2 Tax=Liquorilactobacillus aquaticus TaxID=392566 RepID=A0A0R2CXI4_9LACO|nr:hypothetical protein FC19_GL001451 [Liquorilactobacillus aquaticus DSM 21051]